MKLWWPKFQSKQIAEALNRDTSWVNVIGRKLGLPRHEKQSNWTPEMNAQLTELWQSGKHRGEIARIMKVSIGMIHGKVHRLGIRRPENVKKVMPVRLTPPRQKASQKPRKGTHSRERLRGTRLPAKPKTVPTPQPEPVELILLPIPKVEAPVARNISLLDTGYRWCKFIKGRDDKCCGHPVRWLGQPYCEYHHTLCHTRRTDGAIVN